MKDKFDDFVFEMNDSLDSLIIFVESLNIEELLPLDYSWESLDRIESLYSLYLDDKISIDTSEGVFVTRLARYLGETLRKNMGGKWVQCQNPKDFAYGLPALGFIDNMNPEYAYNPFDTLETYKVRRVEV